MLPWRTHAPRPTGWCWFKKTLLPRYSRVKRIGGLAFTGHCTAVGNPSSVECADLAGAGNGRYRGTSRLKIGSTVYLK